MKRIIQTLSLVALLSGCPGEKEAELLTEKESREQLCERQYGEIREAMLWKYANTDGDNVLTQAEIDHFDVDFFKTGGANLVSGERPFWYDHEKGRVGPVPYSVLVDWQLVYAGRKGDYLSKSKEGGWSFEY
tara:strand:+ start:97 stop:492 length:396 start_codon:yes stop_codon:yes gene_type:complete